MLGRESWLTAERVGLTQGTLLIVETLNYYLMIKIIRAGSSISLPNYKGAFFFFKEQMPTALFQGQCLLVSLVTESVPWAHLAQSRSPTACPGSPRICISSSWNKAQHRAGTLNIYWVNKCVIIPNWQLRKPSLGEMAYLTENDRAGWWRRQDSQLGIRGPQRWGYRNDCVDFSVRG